MSSLFGVFVAEANSIRNETDERNYVNISSRDLTPKRLVQIADPFVRDGYKLNSIQLRDRYTDAFVAEKKVCATYNHDKRKVSFGRRKGFIFKGSKYSADEVIDLSNEMLVVLDKDISA
jgi:hypothetical protein